MKIRMVQQMSGSRADGTVWPQPGAILEVSDEEGMELCRQHAGHSHPIAVPVEERAAEERPAPPDPAIETRDEPDVYLHSEDAPRVDQPSRRPAGPQVRTTKPRSSRTI